MGRRRKGKAGGAAGLNNQSPARRWAVDYDYLAQLTPAERQWLGDFTDLHYGADFRSDLGAEVPKPDRRQGYTDKRSAREDVYTHALDVDAHEERVPSEYEDLGPTPEYLDTPAYKDARDRYRRQLTPTRRYVAPKDTPALQRARWKLDRLTPKPPDED